MISHCYVSFKIRKATNGCGGIADDGRLFRLVLGVFLYNKGITQTGLRTGLPPFL